MRYTIHIITVLFVAAFTACSYDEDLYTVSVAVRLDFPKSYTDSKAGLRVEFQDNTSSVFVGTTDTSGVAHFNVPTGIYSARSSARKLTYDWQYFFNGSRDKIAVASDSTHVIDLPLTMSRKRVVH